MTELEDLRREIDAIDAGLVKLLVRRFGCSRRVAAVKLREKLAVLDAKREREVLERAAALAGEADAPAVRRVLAGIMAASRELQGELVK